MSSPTPPKNNQPAMGKPAPANSELQRLIRAGRYSWDGLCAAIREEAAVRLECLVLVVSMPLAFLLSHTIIEAVALIAVVVAVVVVELINSALEKICDALTTDYHPAIKRAKDYGSLAVLLTIIVAVAVWAVVLLE